MSNELVLYLYSFDVVRNLKESFPFYLQAKYLWIFGIKRNWIWKMVEFQFWIFKITKLTGTSSSFWPSSSEFL